VPRMRVGRVLLAGDCAHLVSPFGARGLNSGVQDAENAAWKLAHVHNGWSPESLLETYHVERHAAAVENLTVTAATMRFLVPRTEADRAYRRDVLDRAAINPAARTLSRSKGATNKVLLTECDALQFSIFQRNPVGGTYDQYPTATIADTKLVQVTWTCSRMILGSEVNTDLSNSGNWTAVTPQAPMRPSSTSF